jgi:hypothetical protein
MPDVIRYRLLVLMFLCFGVAYRVLCLPVGLLVLSAGGLVLVGHPWLALGVLMGALVYYELIFWLFVGRWRR